MLFYYTNDEEKFNELCHKCLQDIMVGKVNRALVKKISSISVYQQSEEDTDQGCSVNLTFQNDPTVYDHLKSGLLCYKMNEDFHDVNLFYSEQNILLTFIADDLDLLCKEIQNLPDFVFQCLLDVEINVKVNSNVNSFEDRYLTRRFIDACSENSILASGCYYVTEEETINKDTFYAWLAIILGRCLTSASSGQLHVDFALDMPLLLTRIYEVTGKVYTQATLDKHIVRR